jgi:4-amino-4-deoxy-L-arabinose transferase-like glycosyltransferase
LSKIRSALAWLLPACGIVASCGWIGLIEPTEARYAEIAREMLKSGDWLIPRLNGIPHFHKPPLSYWLSAAGMALFGPNPWGARIGTALAAAFVLWCTSRLARLAGGALGPAFLGSCVLFVVLAHQLASDMFLAAAVAGFYVAILDPRTRESLWPYLAMAIGFMIKGPVVLILTVAPLLLAAAWARDVSLARWLRSGWGWVLFAVIALPWYIAVLVRTPGLLTYFMKHQLWERYTTTIHQRGGPVYYFLIVIVVGLLPWTWAALRGLVDAARMATSQRNQTDAVLASWVLLPLVFFSFSGSKLPAYVLPLFPALAVLASIWPSEARRGMWLRAALALSVITVALCAAATPFDDRLCSPRQMVQKLQSLRRPGEHVVEYGTFNAGVPFYLNETVPMLEVPREDGFEEAEEHARAFITRADLARMVNTSGRVWVVGRRAACYDLAKALGFKATHVAGFQDRSVLSFEPAR